MTTTEQATEFSRRRALPGVTVEYLNSARSQDVLLSYNGEPVGTKTNLFTRGKVSSILYVLPPLPEGLK